MRTIEAAALSALTLATGCAQPERLRVNDGETACAAKVEEIALPAGIEAKEAMLISFIMGERNPVDSSAHTINTDAGDDLAFPLEAGVSAYFEAAKNAQYCLAAVFLVGEKEGETLPFGPFYDQHPLNTRVSCDLEAIHQARGSVITGSCK